jgi:glycosyltransferase 2 family protein
MKKGALTALKIFVSFGILVYLFTRVVHLDDLWATLKVAKVSYFLAAVAVYLAVQTLSAYRWYLLLKPLKITTSFARILALFYLGMYFNFFLPSSIGGDFFKVYYLNKETSRLSASTASVFVDRDIGMGGLVLIALVAATLGGTSLPLKNGVLLAPIFALIGLAFVAANLALFYRPTYKLLHRLLKLFKMRKADVKVENLFESVNSYRGKWRLATVALLISLGVQIGCAIVNMLGAGAIGLHTKHGWIDFMVFTPAIGLIGMMPLSVNGAGWREASYIWLFQSVGAAAPEAATLSLLWLGVIVVTSLPGGIIYIAEGRQGKDRKKASKVADTEIREIGAPINQSQEEEPVSTI